MNRFLSSSTLDSQVSQIENLIQNINSSSLSPVETVFSGNLVADSLNGITTSGFVSGPVSSLDNGICTFDGVSGKLIQDSTVLIDNSEISGLVSTEYTNQGSAPTAPSSGFVKLYSDLSDNIHLLTSTSDEIIGGDVLATSVVALNAGGSPYTTVQDLQNIFHSAGYTSGGNITDNGNGSISVSSGAGFLRDSNSSVADCYFIAWPAATNIALTDANLNYIIVQWNAGTPNVIASTTEPNNNSEFSLGTIYRSGTTLHITSQSKHTVGDHANLMIKRSMATKLIAREENGGALITETGTRNIAVSEGRFWIGLTQYTTASFDSTVGTFRYFYNSASYTEVAGQTQINNTQYDNAGTLTALTNNQYGVHWVFLGADGDIYVIYGTDSYTLSEATDIASPPSVLPSHFNMHTTLIGKIIIQKNSSTFTSITSAFTNSFTASQNNVNIVNGVGTDEAICRFDSNGNTIQDSVITISDTGLITINSIPTAPIFYIETSNIVCGTSSGENLTTGAGSNTLLGFGTGNKITNGTENTHFGSYAGYFQSGSENTAIGSQAMAGGLPSGSNGSFNTSVGKESLLVLTTGNYNTSIGMQAGVSLDAGDNCTFLGATSDGVAGFDNQTSIGYGATCDLANQITLGNNLVSVIRHGGNVNCTLGESDRPFSTIYGNSFVSSIGTFNHGFTRKGTSSSFTMTETASVNLTNCNGVMVIGNTNGVSLANTTRSTLIGTTILGSATKADHTVCIGGLNLVEQTGGLMYYNTMIGSSAGEHLNAEKNTAVGYRALEGKTGLATGIQNTAFGVSTGINITTCSDSTFIGYACGQAITSGNNNTFLGSSTNGVAGSSNQTAIGYQATCTAANQIVLGNSSVTEVRTTGSLKIGTGAINSSAIVDLESTTKGFLPPRMTTLQKNAITPIAGLMLWDTDLDKLQVYNGGTWVNLN